MKAYQPYLGFSKLLRNARTVLIDERLRLEPIRKRFSSQSRRSHSFIPVQLLQLYDKARFFFNMDLSVNSNSLRWNHIPVPLSYGPKAYRNSFKSVPCGHVRPWFTRTDVRDGAC